MKREKRSLKYEPQEDGKFWYIGESGGGPIHAGDEVAVLYRGEESETDARRLVAAYNACKGISTDRLDKMVPGTLANLLDLKASRSQLTEARIAEIIDKRMVKACYEPMGKEIAALIVSANLLTLKGDK